MSHESQHTNTLKPATIQLNGRHLIEASAGTGKTYNITRLYVRLLLETELTVQQILVMTFTRAATEELRGRIEEALREAIVDWDTLDDEFFVEMREHRGIDRAIVTRKLSPALLELDDAAVFTIHGFCSRVLSQQAFDSGMPLEIDMEADCSELRLEAVRDWLREVSQDEQTFMRLKQGVSTSDNDSNWHEPEKFLKTFDEAIRSQAPLQVPTQECHDLERAMALESLSEQYRDTKETICQDLVALQDRLFELLVNGRKDEVKRTAEWQALVDWLSQNDTEPCPKSAKGFVGGGRYQKRHVGEDIYDFLIDTFAPFKALYGAYDKALKQIEQNFTDRLEHLPVYALVAEGISAIRAKIVASKERLGQLDFDDLVNCLHQQVTGSDGVTLIQAIRQQYPVALVDEFQDTDPKQYGILNAIYPIQNNGEQALMMIGDPKQAIYGFRGGDIFAYLKARQEAQHSWHLDTNWRSLSQVVAGYNRLFWGGPLSQPAKDVFGYGIGYQQINATEYAKAAKQRLQDSNSKRRAINYAWLPQITSPSGARGQATTADYTQGLANWCTGEIVRLLDQASLGEQPLQERDIAILVRTGREAEAMRDALSSVGLPSVYLSDKANVFESEQAQELAMALEGIWDNENDRKITAALSTHLLGFSAMQLAQLQQADHIEQWEQAKDRMFQLRQLWEQKGCLAVVLDMLHHSYRPAAFQNERALTNYIHLAESLQRASRQYKQPLQLLKWFSEQRASRSGQEENEQRLESDENLIRIVTQHGSKGLEYPIVFVPFASKFKDETRFGQQKKECLTYHNAEAQSAVLQLGQTNMALSSVQQEGEAEAKRLLYVAITRAAQRCYLGVAPFDKSQGSPLGLTLGLTDIEAWQGALQQLVSSADDSSYLLTISDQEPLRKKTSSTLTQEPLKPAIFNSDISEHWRLSSFSALARNAQHVRLDRKEHADEPASSSSIIPAPIETHTLALRFRLKKGAAAGNLLHDTLEHTDFSQPNWPRALEGPVERFGGLEKEELVELEAWLAECLSTSLPPLHEGDKAFSLSALNISQTLRESEFYYPMKQVQSAQLMRCLQIHRGTEQAVRLPDMDVLEGLMHGFIDLIFESQGRYYVADYKSTHLGDRFEDYQSAALKQNNEHHFYDLQYLIYCVALHRLLGQRLSDYQPAKHFGGVYYLYLRGMSAENAEPYGVFHTTITPPLLAQLDALFRDQGNDALFQVGEA